MNRHSAHASLPALTLALGIALAGPAGAQEADAGEAPAVFQSPRSESPRLDPRGEDAADAPAPPVRNRPEVWGRFGQPRDVPPPGDRPETRPGPDRGDQGDEGDRRRREGWGDPDDPRNRDREDRRDRHDRWDREDRWDRWDHYTPYTPPPRRPPRYDPYGYPPVWTPPYRYRGDRWVPPPGFTPRRWSYGEVLPWTWWTPRYRIESWWTYGLPVPPLGFAWVRLGRDAVLVDLWTGRVVQIAFSLFW